MPGYHASVNLFETKQLFFSTTSHPLYQLRVVCPISHILWSHRKKRTYSICLLSVIYDNYFIFLEQVHHQSFCKPCRNNPSDVYHV